MCKIEKGLHISWELNLPQPSTNHSARTELGGLSADTLQLRIAAFARVQRLPLQDFLPRLFVVGVVDLNDVRHVLLLDVLVLPATALAQHRVPGHLLAGIDPELFGAILGDLGNGGRLAFGGQWEGLVGCWLLVGSGKGWSGAGFFEECE